MGCRLRSVIQKRQWPIRLALRGRQVWNCFFMRVLVLCMVFPRGGKELWCHECSCHAIENFWSIFLSRQTILDSNRYGKEIWDTNPTFSFPLSLILRECGHHSCPSFSPLIFLLLLAILLQLQIGPTDLFMVVPRNDAIFPKLHTNRY